MKDRLTIPGVKRDKVRVEHARQRKTWEYFTGCRFSGRGVAKELKSFGTTLGNYRKLVVT
jgi:hypothetical protein